MQPWHRMGEQGDSTPKPGSREVREIKQPRAITVSQTTRTGLFGRGNHHHQDQRSQSGGKHHSCRLQKLLLLTHGPCPFLQALHRWNHLPQLGLSSRPQPTGLVLLCPWTSLSTGLPPPPPLPPPQAPGPPRPELFPAGAHVGAQRDPPSSTTLGQRSPQLRLLVSPPAPPYIPSAPHHRHHQQPIRRGGATPPPLTRPMGGRGARHAANQEAQVPPSPLPATAPQCEKPPQPHPPPSLSRPEDARGAVSAPPYPHPTP